MKRKLEIPQMSTSDIAKWYTTIKPIVRNCGIPTYLRKLSDQELERSGVNWLVKQKDFAEIVDFSKLSVLADVTMLHTYGYHGFFKPTVSEVIKQIPKKHLKKVVAFEIICGSIGTSTFFKPEFDAGFHISVVRLYQAKDESNEAAQPITRYPYDNCKIPFGMTDEEFLGIKSLLG